MKHSITHDHHLPEFGFSYKKRVMLLGSKERSTKKYIKEISDLKKENFVYVDESVIVRTSYKNRGWKKE